MNRIVLLTSFVLSVLIIISGCSGGNTVPVLPGSGEGMAEINTKGAHGAQTHLWGFYDVMIDLETGEVIWDLNRGAMFTVNVVNFVNKPPTNLAFAINDTPIGADYIDVDIDVSITHPFPGLNQYDGYDVRGVFIGDASGVLDYGSGLECGVQGVDQFMFDDPVNEDGGGPDGFTRWYNPVEFPVKGLFGYTEGAFATKGYTGNATLCPYKYYADGLNVGDDLYEFLETTPDSGVFAAGSTNTRNYYLRFPNTKGVRYNYAILASWIEEDVHPANATEAVACSTYVTPDLYYTSPTENGGDLVLDLTLYDWEHQPSTIFIESSVLSSVYEFTSTDLVPTGGGENFSTWHVEIPSDNLTGFDDNYYWVIAQYDNYDYGNDFGVPNDAEDEILAAFFRYDLYISQESPCQDPVVMSISPDSALSGMVLNDAGITGSNLIEGPDLAASLVKDGEEDILATDVQYVDDSNITADFDLEGAATGLWDLVVTNGCGKVGTGVELFEVVSCGAIQGFNTDYDVCITTGSPHRVFGNLAGMAATQTGTPYVIGVTQAYNELGAMVASSGLVASAQFLSSTSGVGYINRDIVCDSQNRLYFTDSTDTTRLRYFPFSSSTGFGAVTDFGNIDSGWSIYRITIDELDNPVVLANMGNDMRVYHWDDGAADWITTDVPGDVTQNNFMMVGDFDWNPYQDHYVFVRWVSNYQCDLYAVDMDGNLVKTVTDIFEGNYATGLPGIYIDVNDPMCRIVAWGSFLSYGTQHAPFTRMTAAYVDSVTTTLFSGNITGNLNVASPRGQVAKGAGRLIIGVHYLNVWGKAPLPVDW